MSDLKFYKNAYKQLRTRCIETATDYFDRGHYYGKQRGKQQRCQRNGNDCNDRVAKSAYRQTCVERLAAYEETCSDKEESGLE